jgi:hypothetical protein
MRPPRRRELRSGKFVFPKPVSPKAASLEADGFQGKLKPFENGSYKTHFPGVCKH